MVNIDYLLALFIHPSIKLSTYKLNCNSLYLCFSLSCIFLTIMFLKNPFTNEFI